MPVRSDPIGLRPTDEIISSHLNNFRRFRTWVGAAYAVDLPDPGLTDLPSLKKFCSGLLLPSSGHLWSGPIKRLRLRDRLSIAGSLFLFRKTLPATRPSLDAYIKHMASPAPSPPSGYIRFVTDELNRMFPLGWDKGYKSKVYSTTLSTSSCLENSRSKGGARGTLELGFDSRADFIKLALDKYASPKKKVDLVRATVVKTAGKDRIVTVNSSDMTFLTPYHKLIYDFVSKQHWCLRGEATAQKFSNFRQVNGEVFVSGDYESATDNLNQDVAKHILGTIARRCTRVPVWVRELAASTLGGHIMSGDEMRGYSFSPVLRGQMMGNALSFPLLCLQNYLAFRYYIRRDVPVKINGDDIVFRATRNEFEAWRDGVQACGLTLSLGKTAVQQSWFSLNSTFFVAGTKRVRGCPVLRSTAMFTKPECLSSISGRFNTLKVFSGPRRDYFQTKFLGVHRRWIRGAQCSLQRGFELSLKKEVIFQSGLAEHESYYLSLDKSFDRLATRQIGYYRQKIPEGWRRERVDVVDEKVQREFYEELVEAAWNPEKAPDSVVERGRASGFITLSFVPFSLKTARMLKLSNRMLKNIRTKFNWIDEEKRLTGWVRCALRSSADVSQEEGPWPLVTVGSFEPPPYWKELETYWLD